MTDSPAVPPLIPYLIVAGAEAAIDFYRRAFGATVTLRLDGPGEKIGHAELSLAGRRLYLADEFPEMGYVGPRTRGGTTVSLVLHVPNVDAAVAQALAAGATLGRPVRDEFFGERHGEVLDPFGHRWILGTRLEELSAEEIQRRYQELLQAGYSD